MGPPYSWYKTNLDILDSYHWGFEQFKYRYLFYDDNFKSYSKERSIVLKSLGRNEYREKIPFDEHLKVLEKYYIIYIWTQKERVNQRFRLPQNTVNYKYKRGDRFLGRKIKRARKILGLRNEGISNRTVSVVPNVWWPRDRPKRRWEDWALMVGLRK